MFVALLSAVTPRHQHFCTHAGLMLSVRAVQFYERIIVSRHRKRASGSEVLTVALSMSKFSHFKIGVVLSKGLLTFVLSVS